MESAVRKPFQGVRQILQFNYHFYTAVVLAILFLSLSFFIYPQWGSYFLWIVLAISLPALSSLIISWYVYEASGIYRFEWMKNLPVENGDTVLNIHAGFDESSQLLLETFPGVKLAVFDFYDPVKHTEPAIRRARKKYPPFPGTVSIRDGLLPVEDGTVRTAFLIFSAHEIRSSEERSSFLKHIGNKLVPGGQIVLVEHLRDLPNCLAYTIGAFHFYTGGQWRKTFDAAGLRLCRQEKINPFVHLMILEHDRNAS